MTRSPLRTFARNGLLAAVAAASLLPQPWKGRLATFGPLHDCAHIAVFFLASVLTMRRLWKMRELPIASSILGLFGVALEVLQTRVYHNRLEIYDILDDLAGIALGVLGSTALGVDHSCPR